MYHVTARKITDESLLRRACEMTMHGYPSSMTLSKIYQCEHSPMRTQLFWIELVSIPTFVSVHFVRHHVGVEHFVLSNREDRGGDEHAGRHSPVNHGMLINAQALVNMARKRLCNKAHVETQAVMKAIRAAVAQEDPALAGFMVRECDYRNGFCSEVKSCREDAEWQT